MLGRYGTKLYTKIITMLSVDNIYALMLRQRLREKGITPLMTTRFVAGVNMGNKHEEILKSRAPIYGEALVNLHCTQELCDVFDGFEGKAFTTFGTMEQWKAHKAAIHLALTKIARIATGSFHEDNYYDGSNYIEIARKIMMGESTLPKE